MKFTKQHKIAAYEYCLKQVEWYYLRDNPSFEAPYVCLMLRAYYGKVLGKKWKETDTDHLMATVFSDMKDCLKNYSTAYALPNTEEGYLVRITMCQYCIDLLTTKK